MASIKRTNECSSFKGADEYLFSVEAARLYCHARYYWTVCRKEKTEELVAWGNASSKQEAEESARNEIANLTAAFGGEGYLPRALRGWADAQIFQASSTLSFLFMQVSDHPSRRAVHF
jgi:hypothetical protein